MGDVINLLLADDNIEFVEFLQGVLNNEQDIKVKGIAKDGYEALEMIETLKPDVVILDIIMPNLDGIGVLEKLAALHGKARPIVIMLSSIGKDSFIQKTISLGADYYMVKPANAESLISRIRQIYGEKDTSYLKSTAKIVGEKKNKPIDDDNLELEVSNFLKGIGIPIHMTGYQYLREALIRVLTSKGKMLRSVTKTLYPQISERFNTSPEKVERSIRNSIENAWVKGNKEYIEDVFGHNLKGRPTNSEFIATAVEKIKFS
jgi:two-component system response regulator (stage 0 sporulation protein A)